MDTFRRNYLERGIEEKIITPTQDLFTMDVVEHESKKRWFLYHRPDLLDGVL